MVARFVTDTNPPTLGAVMLNALQGKVSEPTACISEFDKRISSATVSRLEVPWILNTPVTAVWTTPPLSALAGRIIGEESTKVAVGYVALWMPIVWMCASRIASLLLSLSTSTVNAAALAVTTWPDWAKVAVPVMADVRPTASLSAGRNPSFSRTRYPATEPVAIVHRPAKLVPEGTGVAPADELNDSGLGDEVGNRTK